MSNLKENELVLIKKNFAYTTSLIVAEYFNKEHYNIIRDIENLDCSKEFSALNFEGAKYKDAQGKMRKLYKIKKDGLVFLIMGYRGKKASELKEKYIKRFNEMENLLRERQTPEWQQQRIQAKSSTNTLHDDIHNKFIHYAINKGSKTYSTRPTLAYTHFDTPINKALGINKNSRETLDTLNQNLLDIMNKSCSCIIDIEINKDTDYHDIVQISKNKINKISNVFFE